MTFIADGKNIEIRAVFSWFDVYINNTMILHHISQEDADSLIKAIKKSSGSHTKENK